MNYETKSEAKKFPLEVKLPSGKVAIIKSFKGRDCMQAQRVCGGDQEKYIPALIAMTTSIDGAAIVPEDLEDMDGRDYIALFAEFATVAFT